MEAEDGLAWGTRRVSLLVALAVLFEIALSFLDLLFGPWVATHWEELFNARAGAQLACGHVDALERMQYRTFCGGCTGEAILAAPLYLSLGPTVLVWKGMLLLFHGGVLAAGAILCGRLSGGRAALAWVALIAAAPGWYRELIHTGWGNHVESAAFPMLALVALTSRSPSARSSLGLGLLAGLLTGLGLWFGQTSAWALAALSLATLLGNGGGTEGTWGGWRALLGRSAGMVVGGLIGMIPWFAYYYGRPRDTDATLDWWTNLRLAPPEALMDWLWGPYAREHLWDPPDYGEVSLAGMWWAAIWVVGLWGMVRGLLQWRFGAEYRPPTALSWIAPLSLGFLVAVYWVRYDLWHNLPDLYVNGAFNLRYRTPLIPILTLGAALGLGWPYAGRGARWAMGLVGLLLVAFPLSLRFGQWGAFNAQALGLRVYQHEGWADRTVPLGSPPQHLARAQGRKVDLEAALGFLESHQDRLVDCRLDHQVELGRRLGLAAADPARQDLRSWIPRALASASQDSERTLLIDGIARGLISDQGVLAPNLDARIVELDAFSSGPEGTPLGQAVLRLGGRRAHEAFSPETDGSRSGALQEGICEGRGYGRVREAAGLGRRPPEGGLPRFVIEQKAGSCLGTAAYAWGVGYGWGRDGGCGAEAEQRLAAELRSGSAGEDGPLAAALEGLRASCARYR